MWSKRSAILESRTFVNTIKVLMNAKTQGACSKTIDVHFNLNNILSQSILSS